MHRRLDSKYKEVIGSDLKGRVWELHKLILNDGRWFPETADVIFFSEKFVF